LLVIVPTVATFIGVKRWLFQKEGTAIWIAADLLKP